MNFLKSILSAVVLMTASVTAIAHVNSFNPTVHYYAVGIPYTETEDCFPVLTFKTCTQEGSGCVEEVLEEGVYNQLYYTLYEIEGTTRFRCFIPLYEEP